ncbi:hypothetical protein BU14_0076s0009 [Porphyra umbilicalis]|uniref:Uncharacterized protein n=1 Tax=Porphyra umbilicalis TaxID=2786 RepID=A0A1X6PFK6_PORUM|nr:hypothetical protein BU14_0076s0009 [Porphyra umbilicalis]|eukprot:OSX79453.1 hypothetical protein BU14_0076s0009 [Porphyra umbilicalis]
MASNKRSASALDLPNEKRGQMKSTTTDACLEASKLSPFHVLRRFTDAKLMHKSRRNKKIGSHLCALRVADPLFTPLIAARRCSLERKKKHSGGNTPCGAPPAPSLAATADGRPWPAPPPRAGLTHHGRAPAPNVPGWRTGGRPTCRAGRLSLQLPPTLSLSRLGGGGCRVAVHKVARLAAMEIYGQVTSNCARYVVVRSVIVVGGGITTPPPPSPYLRRERATMAPPPPPALDWTVTEQLRECRRSRHAGRRRKPPWRPPFLPPPFLPPPFLPPPFLPPPPPPPPPPSPCGPTATAPPSAANRRRRVDRPPPRLLCRMVHSAACPYCWAYYDYSSHPPPAVPLRRDSDK